jgi:hypothetical protein
VYEIDKINAVNSSMALIINSVLCTFFVPIITLLCGSLITRRTNKKVHAIVSKIQAAQIKEIISSFIVLIV